MTIALILMLLTILWCTKALGWRNSYRFTGLVLALIFLALTPPVNHRLMGALESWEPAEAHCRPDAPPAQYLVMLGGTRSGGLATNWINLTTSSLARLAHAMETADKSPEGTFVFPISTTEANPVRSLLKVTGFPPDQTQYLPGVTNTYDSIARFSQISNADQPGNVGVITSAFHMRRTAQTLRRFDIDFCTLPTDYLSHSGQSGAHLLPTPSTIRNLDLMLHEIVGLVWYRLRGYT